MKNMWLRAAVLCCLASGANAQDTDKKAEAYRFTDTKLIDVTPVKDQARSGTCWSFSGMGLVESAIFPKCGSYVMPMPKKWLSISVCTAMPIWAAAVRSTT